MKLFPVFIGMALEALERIKRIANPYRRYAVLQDLRKIVDELYFVYGNEPTDDRIRRQPIFELSYRALSVINVQVETLLCECSNIYFHA